MGSTVGHLLENVPGCWTEQPVGLPWVRRSAGLATLGHSLSGLVGVVGALAWALHSGLKALQSSRGKGQQSREQEQREAQVGTAAGEEDTLNQVGSMERKA